MIRALQQRFRWVPVVLMVLWGSSGLAWGQPTTTVRPVLSADDVPRSKASADRIEMLAIDTLFYVENNGLRRILVDLNGHRFKMVSDPDEVERSANAFLMPDYGTITVDIAALTIPGEPNFVTFTSQGPASAEAEVVLSPVPVIGQTVAYAIETLQPLPVQFRLLNNHPNPFQQETTITYAIPDTRINGVDVRLAVYDALGREVAVLVEERRYPGQHAASVDAICRGGLRHVLRPPYRGRLTRYHPDGACAVSVLLKPLSMRCEGAEPTTRACGVACRAGHARRASDTPDFAESVDGRHSTVVGLRPDPASGTARPGR